MEIWLIVVLVLVTIILTLVIASIEQNKKVKMMKEAVASQRYFNETKVIEDKLALFQKIFHMILNQMLKNSRSLQF